MLHPDAYHTSIHRRFRRLVRRSFSEGGSVFSLERAGSSPGSPDVALAKAGRLRHPPPKGGEIGILYHPPKNKSFSLLAISQHLAELEFHLRRLSVREGGYLSD